MVKYISSEQTQSVQISDSLALVLKNDTSGKKWISQQIYQKEILLSAISLRVLSAVKSFSLEEVKMAQCFGCTLLSWN